MKTGYAAVVQFQDGGRAFDWSVPDAIAYQAVVDVIHMNRAVAQAFLVPASYEQTHAIDWDTISPVDLDRAGCGFSILYPRDKSSG